MTTTPLDAEARSRAIHSRANPNLDQRIADALDILVEARRLGKNPNLETLWRDFGGARNLLVELVKVDLQCRFELGDEASVREYLDRFPGLQDESVRLMSLLYEEYCLLEEAGKEPDPESFCQRYEPWYDSLASQLRYHQAVTRLVPVTKPLKFPSPGDHFLRFRLQSLLGRGGQARVYLARDNEMGGRPTALKVSEDRGDEPSMMGRLQHPHIMPVYTVVRDPETGLRGLCMPYRPGISLDDLLRKIQEVPANNRTTRLLLQTLDPDDPSRLKEAPGWQGFPAQDLFPYGSAWIGARLAEALDHAHHCGINHRDVKPANILLTLNEGPQLLDFNLAHDDHRTVDPENAALGGTLPYMSPEQLDAFRDPECWGDVGVTSDVYSLGLVLHELVSGQRPATPDESTPISIAIGELIQQRMFGVRSARELNPNVPSGLDAIISKAIDPDPDERYQSASALADDLDRFILRQPLVGTSNPSLKERVFAWIHRRRFTLLSGLLYGMVTFLLLVIVLVWINQSNNSEMRQYNQVLREIGEDRNSLSMIDDSLMKSKVISRIWGNYQECHYIVENSLRPQWTIHTPVERIEIASKASKLYRTIYDFAPTFNVSSKQMQQYRREAIYWSHQFEVEAERRRSFRGLSDESIRQTRKELREIQRKVGF